MPYADRQKQLAYQRKWNKGYYQTHRETERKRITRRKKEITRWFLKFKAGLSCQRCGEANAACLDFHHVDSRGKDFNLGQVQSWGWGRERIMREVKKCIVLCANCHRKRHARLRMIK